MSRFLVIGAHPDDPDGVFGGTACHLVQRGHTIQFVSVTNGNHGHYSQPPEQLAPRRYHEAQTAAEKLGISKYIIMDNPDGELEASLVNRKKLIGIIREFQPDVVISHRAVDYHPDHRATGQLVQDTAYMIMVPQLYPEFPIPEKNPVYAYSYDPFEDPRPVRPDVAVEIDSVLDQKCQAWTCHESQYLEWLPWTRGERNLPLKLENTPESRQQIMANNLNTNKKEAILARQTLIEEYGPETAKKVHHAEIFEQSKYSRTLPLEEFRRLFLNS